MADLKPCPFCGGKAIRMFLAMNTVWGFGSTVHYEERNFGSGKGHIECCKCHVKQPHDYSKIVNAEKAWNRRDGKQEDSKYAE